MDLEDINRAITLLQNKLDDNVFDFDDVTIDPNRTYKFIKYKREGKLLSEKSNDLTISSEKSMAIVPNKSSETNIFDKFIRDEQTIIKNIESQIKSLGLNIS